MYNRRCIIRIDFNSGMDCRCGGPANKQGDVHFQARHLFGHVHHLLQRRCDQPAQANNIHIFIHGSLQDFFCRNHHPQVDHFKIVAGQNHPDNIFPDIVHIAFNGGQQYFSCWATLPWFSFFSLDVRKQHCHSFFHDPCTFYYLGQKHFSWAK